MKAHTRKRDVDTLGTLRVDSSTVEIAQPRNHLEAFPIFQPRYTPKFTGFNMVSDVYRNPLFGSQGAWDRAGGDDGNFWVYNSEPKAAWTWLRALNVGVQNVGVGRHISTLVFRRATGGCGGKW